MIQIQIPDLDVIKHIDFVVKINPEPWRVGKICTRNVNKTAKSGKPKIVTMGEDPKSAIFKRSFVTQCLSHRPQSESNLMKMPIFLCLDFYMPRRKQDKDVVRVLPVTRPDTTNMQKLTEDCLTGIFWDDDNAVVNVISSKRYVDKQEDDPHIRVEIFYCKQKDNVRTNGFKKEQKEKE